MTTQTNPRPNSSFLPASLPSLVIALLILAAWLVLGALAAYIASNQAAGYYDFRAYFDAAVRLNSGASPYYPIPDRHLYLYPPLLAQLLMPLTASLTYDVTAVIWFLLNFATLGLAFLMLHPHIPAHNRRILWLLPILFIPVLKALYVGQVTFIMLALLTGIWAAVRGDRRVLAGILLAVACWLKVFPALLVLYFLWKRDWAVFRGVLIGGLAFAILQIMISGPGLLLESFRAIFVLADEVQSAGAFKNSSIMGFASRLFLDNPNYEVLLSNPALYSVTRGLLMLLVAGLTIFGVIRPSQTVSAAHQTDADEGNRFDLEYCLVIIATLLLSPVLWVSGMAVLLLVYSLLLLRPQPIPVHHRTTRRLLQLSFALTSLYHLMLLSYNPRNPLILSIGFFGVFLLWAVTASALLTYKTSSEPRS